MKPAAQAPKAAPRGDRAAVEAALPVDVVRSKRRRKTVQARLVDGRLRLLIPAHLSAADEAHWVQEMRRRFDRRARSSDIDLPARSRRLARALDLPEPAGIRWVPNQTTRWGSCTPATGEIRLSDRLSAFPAWVIDYVVVHELAHLVEANHGPRFHALEQRYPKAERAIGFLLAQGFDPHHPGGDDAGGESLVGGEPAPPAASPLAAGHAGASRAPGRRRRTISTDQLALPV